MKYTNQKVEQIISLYNQGFNPTDIAIQLNTYNTTIRRILLRNGFKLENPSKAQAKVKKNYFSDLSCPKVQYWLGYMCADGNIAKDPVNRINIASNKDPEHLNKYIDFLDNTVPLKKYFNKKYEVWEYAVNFCNKEVKDYLISLGITPAKSKTLKVNFPITWDFFRGVFDGDGCVREINKKYIKTSISVEIATASPHFLEQIIKFLTKEDVYFAYRKNANTYIVTVCRAESVKKVYDLMYSDSSVSLNRKRELFGSLLKKFNR